MGIRLTKKMSITIITLTVLILLSSGFLIVKVFVWNGYNEATQVEKQLRKELDKLKKDPDDLEARARLMEALYKKEQFEEAKVQAEYIISHQKESTEIRLKALYYRALVNGIDREYQLAFEDLHEIVSINDQFGEAWLSLARLYLSTGDLAEAEAANGKASEILGDQAEPMFVKGQIHYLNGNKKMAEKAIKQALKLDPNHGQAKELLNQLTKET